MGLDIQLTDEVHKILREIPDPERAFSHLIYRVYEVHEEDEKQFPFLSGVDIYGDTTFNPLQMPKVLEELKYISSKWAMDDEQKALLKEVIALCEECKAAGHHIYVVFYGD